MHIFSKWEETIVPGENPSMHSESMQTSHRKAPDQEMILQPSPYEETAEQKYQIKRGEIKRSSRLHTSSNIKEKQNSVPALG